MFLILVVAIGAPFATACSSGKKSVRNASDVLGDDTPRRFHRAVAFTLLRTGQPARALPHIRKLVRYDPDAAEPRYLMGRAYADMREHAEARNLLEQAIARDESFAPAHAMLGIVLDAMSQHKTAEQSHRRALALNPRRPSYHNNLGFSLYLQGRHQKAVAAYEAALVLDPGFRRAHNNLGFVHGKLGEDDDARRHFLLAGDAVRADANMGFVYEQRGELERARELYERALEQAPDLAAAKQRLNHVLEELEQGGTR
jgi:Flp pilus assembly protein TadD